MSELPLPRYTRVPPFRLGDRLRRAREDCGYSQAEVADMLGIGQRTISSYEGDETVPSLHVLRLWAYFCQVDISWLAWGDPAAPEPMPTTWKRRRGQGEHDTRGPTIWFHERQQVAKASGNAQVAV